MRHDGREYAEQEMIFGIEQEYTFAPGRHPARVHRSAASPTAGPLLLRRLQGRIMGRDIVEEHPRRCIDAGLAISGTNPEVIARPVVVPDRTRSTRSASATSYVARLAAASHRRDFDVVISFAAKPVKGDLETGARAPTNFSTAAMRDSYDRSSGVQAIGNKLELHVNELRHDIESRLTGAHETSPYNQFSYGVSDRGASIRIPWQVEKDGKGYAEDRRPNSNCDPYTVTRLIVDTVCSDAE